MSASFRPVQEIWGEHSSMFLEYNDVIRFFDELANRIGEQTCENEYGEVTSVFFSNGELLFDYVENAPEFNVASFSDSLRFNAPDETIAAAWLVEGRAEKRAHLEMLMSNFKNMASEWRKSLDKSGAITFYVD